MIGIDNRVRLLEEPIYPTDLIQVFLPLGGMLDYDTEIDILVLGFYLTGNLLAVSCV